MGQGNDDLEVSPAEIRKAIAEARSELAEHLRNLHLSPSPIGGDSSGESKMPATEKTSSQKKQTPDKSRKTASKKAETKAKPLATTAQSKAKASETKSSPKKKTAASNKRNGLAAKAGQMVDTMAAGAVVGAVQGAARMIAEKESNSLKASGKKPRSTAKVLEEMAPGAAMGAVVGAAETVVPNPRTSGKQSKEAKR